MPYLISVCSIIRIQGFILVGDPNLTREVWCLVAMLIINMYLFVQGFRVLILACSTLRFKERESLACHF